MNKKFRKLRGFTLIEMLLVLAVLAIVGTMIVTKFGDTEKTARTVAAVHNPKTLQQTVEDYKSLYGVYPSKWHSGLAADDLSSVEGLELQVALNMGADTDGGELPAGAITNLYTDGYQVATPGANVKGLILGQSRALHENAIHQLVKGGYLPVSNPASTAGTVPVAEDLVCWVLTGGTNLYRGGTAVAGVWPAPTTYTLGTEAVTIDGKPLSDWTAYDPAEAVVLVACAKEVYWSAVLRGDPNASGKGYFGGDFIKDSQIDLSEPPRDPNARATSAFPYYWAAFYVSPNQVGQEAGYSAKLLGVLDGNLNPVRN